MIDIDYKVSENVNFKVQVPDLNLAFQFLSQSDVMFGVKECGNCASPDLEYKYTTPQGYEYYSIRCRGCRHELKFGQRKEDHTLFAKGWEAPYEKPEGDTDTNQDRGHERNNGYENQDRGSERNSGGYQGRNQSEGDDEIPFGRPSGNNGNRQPAKSSGRGF